MQSWHGRRQQALLAAQKLCSQLTKHAGRWHAQAVGVQAATGRRRRQGQATPLLTSHKATR
jgi:hypothetical protein